MRNFRNRGLMQMGKTLALIGLLSISQIVVGDVDETRFSTCAILEGDLARLECFDTLARDSGLDGPQPVDTNLSGVGDWNVNVEINPIDDSTTVTLILIAESGQSTFGRPIGLIARCRSNETDVYINWNDYLGSEARVLTRVGSRTAQTSRWSISTDNEATFHPRPIVFLRELLEVDRLVAQVTPYNDSPVTAIFNLAGIANAIQPLRETCEW